MKRTLIYFASSLVVLLIASHLSAQQPFPAVSEAEIDKRIMTWQGHFDVHRDEKFHVDQWKGTWNGGLAGAIDPAHAHAYLWISVSGGPTSYVTVLFARDAAHAHQLFERYASMHHVFSSRQAEYGADEMGGRDYNAAARWGNITVFVATPSQDQHELPLNFQRVMERLQKILSTPEK